MAAQDKIFLIEEFAWYRFLCYINLLLFKLKFIHFFISNINEG